jgi:tryptophan-rich sensory protein
MSPTKQVVGLIAWLSLCAAAAAIGGLASIGAAEFYHRLEQPWWGPPASVFGPVWTVLYVLIGVAAWLVWRESEINRSRGALALFTVQLGANAAWTWIFFSWRQGAWALAEIILLWILIAMTIVSFWRTHRLAAALLIPYLVWVGYAAALTWALLTRNSAELS